MTTCSGCPHLSEVIEEDDRWHYRCTQHRLDGGHSVGEMGQHREPPEKPGWCHEGKGQTQATLDRSVTRTLFTGRSASRMG